MEIITAVMPENGVPCRFVDWELGTLFSRLGPKHPIGPNEGKSPYFLLPVVRSLNMEMRVVEEVAIGHDLTPPLSPVAFVLQDSALGSHCSACFSTLPPGLFLPFNPTSSENSCHVPSGAPTPLYCSPRCSSIDSPLHFSSAEPHLLRLFRQSSPETWNDSSDLRLSLRLLHTFMKLPRAGWVTGDRRFSLGAEKDKSLQGNVDKKGTRDCFENQDRACENMGSFCQKDRDLERIAGLMTNRERLMFGENRNHQYQSTDDGCEDPSENTGSLTERIREGAKLLAEARRTCTDDYVAAEAEKGLLLEEMVLCLVLTNAVEVQDKRGCSIGVAVYGTSFSWINHSCSPNTCYRFSLGPEHNEQRRPFRIASAAKGSSCGNGDGGDFLVESNPPIPFSGRNGYGPRVLVRNIKAVSKGEEVTIAYTDLLQPKEIRQAELWLKYRFSCNCQRCGAVPATYVDYALQALSAAGLNCPESPKDEIEKMIESIDDAITDYLSFDDPQSCCKKLENLLTHGRISEEPIEPKEAMPPQKLRLQPCHYLSQNAYTTLASAYKVRASDILALIHEAQRQKLEAFNMYKTSAAYSLLLAGVAHHLFMSEPALVAPVANFFTNAGESMSSLARSSMWDSLPELGPICHELSSISTQKCNRCRLTFEPNYVSPHQNMQLEEVKMKLFNCIADITSVVWSTLASESSFLKLIQHPIDFSWLASPEYNLTPDSESYFAESVVKKGSSLLEAEECNAPLRVNLMLLSFHCLKYGELFSSICYGLSAEMNCL